jgi:hypothetical protein
MIKLSCGFIGLVLVCGSALALGKSDIRDIVLEAYPGAKITEIERETSTAVKNSKPSSASKVILSRSASTTELQISAFTGSIARGLQYRLIRLKSTRLPFAQAVFGLLFSSQLS